MSTTVLITLLIALVPMGWGIWYIASSSVHLARFGRPARNAHSARPPVSRTVNAAPTGNPRRPRTHQPGEPGIFISYRRQDEPNFAGRLYDRLVLQFGRERVFMDVDTIELGLDFTEVINDFLSRCSVMLVVIGRNWLHSADTDGYLRLGKPDDYVRLEIETALHRGMRVIPVLVEHTSIPQTTELPPTLASLARRNGITMTHSSFASDTDRLVDTLNRIVVPR